MSLTPEQLVEAKKFEGEWLLTGVENLEEFLESNGLPWIARKAIAAAGYGVDKTKHVLEILDDGTVKYWNIGRETVVNSYKINGGLQDSKSTWNDDMCKCVWEMKTEGGKTTMHNTFYVGDKGDLLKHSDGSDFKLDDGKICVSVTNCRELSDDGKTLTITITKDWDDDGKKMHTVATQTMQRQS